MDVVSGTAVFAALTLLLGSACWRLSNRFCRGAGNETRAGREKYLIRLLRNGAYLFAVIAVILIVAGVLELVIG
jgi:hypothetical protein